jgi:tetratricopeptide (TPR) repeat protein
MQISRLKFPHISRVFSAILWTTLLAFIIVNIYLASKNTSIIQLFFSSSLSQPFSVESHIKTAVALWNKGMQTTALQEIRIADDLYRANGASVLGSASTPSTILTDWESQPQKLKTDFTFWKSITEKQPDYRDGYIMAGLYAYQMQNMKEALSLLNKAHELDPNYAPLNTLLEKIGK